MNLIFLFQMVRVVSVLFIGIHSHSLFWNIFVSCAWDKLSFVSGHSVPFQCSVLFLFSFSEFPGLVTHFLFIVKVFTIICHAPKANLGIFLEFITLIYWKDNCYFYSVESSFLGTVLSLILSFVSVNVVTVLWWGFLFLFLI